MAESEVTVGVLALQGAFHEHIARLASLNVSSSSFRVRPVAVRNSEQLAQCQGLVIPGGESTAISLGLHNAQLLNPLRAWVAEGKPVWGTCAGMIMLSTIATGGKRGGQSLLGGLDIQVGRNGFGSQVCSFEDAVVFPKLGEAFPGVFIRAPVVEQLLTDPVHQRQVAADLAERGEAALSTVVSPAEMVEGARPPLEILGWLPAHAVPVSAHDFLPSVDATSPTEVVGVHPPKDAHVVAVRQGRQMACSFHPELTTDTRMHAYFVRELILGAP